MPAKKKKAAKKKAYGRRRPKKVKVGDIIHSLACIEAWCAAIRKSLCCLNPDMCLPCADDEEVEAAVGGPVLRLHTGCPPPLRLHTGCPPPQPLC